jgi:hypothetical protein
MDLIRKLKKRFGFRELPETPQVQFNNALQTLRTSANLLARQNKKKKKLWWRCGFNKKKTTKKKRF